MIQYNVWNGSEKDLKDHNNLLNFVFEGRNRKTEFFIWKHLENPLGRSIITYAKYNGKLIGARALQPTMSNDMFFMQSCDTVTDPHFQRQGIFTSLTHLALKQLDAKTPVLSFPNHLSLPANLNAGWEFHTRILPNIGLDPLLSTIYFNRLDKFQALLYIQKLENVTWREYCKWRFFSDSNNSYKYYLYKNNLLIINKRQMSYSINLKNERYKSTISTSPFFLNYSYNLEQKFNIFEKVVHKTTGRGSNLVSLRYKDYLKLLNSETLELSGLMDTF